MKLFKNAFSKKKIAVIAVIAIVALLAASIPAVAWMTKTMTPVVNTFKKAEVTGQVDNTADGVIVTNTSNIDVYLRAVLTPTYYNADGSVNAGTTSEKQAAYLAKIVLPANWVKGSDGYYYYTKPIAPGATATAFKYPAADSVTGLTFKLECNAELIQADPADAVTEAWNCTVSGTDLMPY